MAFTCVWFTFGFLLERKAIMSVQYRPVAGDSRKRGLVFCIAGALVMCAGVLVWSFNRVTLAEEAIVQPIPSDPDALPDEEEKHTGDYDEMFGHLPEGQRNEFKRQRIMMKYVLSNPEFMRTGRIPKEVLARLK